MTVGFENKHSALSSELQVTAANLTQDLHGIYSVNFYL
jgi:hypothetical protein